MKIYGAYNYTPYGSFMGEMEEYKKNKNEFNNLYTEQEYIREFSIYNYNARFYDDSIGRFYSKDIDNEFPSPYVYAGNNSVAFTDPSGKSVLGGILSTVLGIGAIALGILLAPETAGMSLNLSTLGSLALSGGLIGAGISSGVYGASHMNDSFDWADWGVESAIGAGLGIVANWAYTSSIKGIDSLLHNSALKGVGFAMSGVVVGGGLGFTGNGISNLYYSEDFIKQGYIAASIGASIGLVAGAGMGVRRFMKYRVKSDIAQNSRASRNYSSVMNEYREGGKLNSDLQNKGISSHNSSIREINIDNIEYIRHNKTYKVVFQ